MLTPPTPHPFCLRKPHHDNQTSNYCQNGLSPLSLQLRCEREGEEEGGVEKRETHPTKYVSTKHVALENEPSGDFWCQAAADGSLTSHSGCESHTYEIYFTCPFVKTAHRLCLERRGSFRRTPCLSHSEQANQISSPPAEPLGDSVRLPIGRLSGFQFACLFICLFYN